MNNQDVTLESLERDLKLLKWVRYATKEIPNLPKGRLRDSLSDRILLLTTGELPEGDLSQPVPHPVSLTKAIGLIKGSIYQIGKLDPSSDSISTSQLQKISALLEQSLEVLGCPNDPPD